MRVLEGGSERVEGWCVDGASDAVGFTPERQAGPPRRDDRGEGDEVRADVRGCDGQLRSARLGGAVGREVLRHSAGEPLLLGGFERRAGEVRNGHGHRGQRRVWVQNDSQTVLQAVALQNERGNGGRWCDNGGRGARRGSPGLSRRGRRGSGRSFPLLLPLLGLRERVGINECVVWASMRDGGRAQAQ